MRSRDRRLKAHNINQLWARLLVAELVRCGISEFCISPGSRSTPLALAVAECEDSQHVIHFDERGSAYRALGLGKATGKPAVLICTSGTAVANFYPAIIEASMSATPMIILSADRPAELRSCGTSQTIDQVNMFGDYLRWSVDLLPPDEQVGPEFLLTTVDQAVFRSIFSPSGPVQVNCQFREPLAPLGELRDYTGYLKDLSRWLKNSDPYTVCQSETVSVSSTSVERIMAIAKSAKRGVIIAGALPAYVDSAAIADLAEKWQWPVIADICSGVRFTGKRKANVICHADLFLRSNELHARMQPDVVLQFGSPPISKVVNQFCATASSQYVVVADRPDRIDPQHRVSMRLQAQPDSVATLLHEVSTPRSEILRQLVESDSIVQDSIRALSPTPGASLSELHIAGEIVRASTSSRGLFLATSMPIRETDSVAVQSDARLHVSANRGANGIDGTIATAVGFSDGLRLPVTLLIGDLAFLHDLNSLALVAKSRFPVTVVILNNDGGGIFSMLPVANIGPRFEEFFGTPHGRDFRYAAELFDIKYHCPGTAKDFTTVYRHSLKSKKSALIEIACTREGNLRLHRELWKTVQDRIEKQTGK